MTPRRILLSGAPKTSVRFGQIHLSGHPGKQVNTNLSWGRSSHWQVSAIATGGLTAIPSGSLQMILTCYKLVTNGEIDPHGVGGKIVKPQDLYRHSNALARSPAALDGGTSC